MATSLTVSFKPDRKMLALAKRLIQTPGEATAEEIKAICRAYISLVESIGKQLADIRDNPNVSRRS